MVILRLAIIAAVLWFAFRVVKRLLSSGTSRDIRLRDGGKMVNCAVCDVYLPECEAKALGDGKFQCKMH
ncbi:MAG: hypothetical protein O3C28_00160 [Proteobacteria bacterium]|nr:hypothetical protein [Pseudomonadota bacterium]